MTTMRTRLVRLGIACALAVPAAVGAVGAAGSGAQTPDEPVMHLSVNSSKVMDIPGGTHAAGTPLIQWEWHGTDNQLWKHLPFATIGDVDLVVIQSLESGLVLDVAGGSTAEGAAVVQNTWSGALSQIWWTPPFGDGDLFVNMSSAKVVDVSGASQEDGAPLIQWTWNGGPNQVWRFLLADE
ncbi:MAG: RICIN domain-containing protein [Acidimicrobiales bacterium]